MRVTLAVLLAAACVRGAAAADVPVSVDVQISGEVVVVRVECLVRATPRGVWNVLTDYEHATRFISNLERSTVLSRSDERIVVSQRGRMGFGPFAVAVEAVNEILLTPHERTQSRSLSGSMKRYSATTRLISEGEGTRILYRAESVPDVWIPPLIGPALIRSDTRGRFTEFVEEILRRKTQAPP